MKRKLLSILLLLALILCVLPTTSSAAYEDTKDHWGRGQIDKWSSLGIITGANGLFHPEDPITRGDLAVILDRIMNYESVSQTQFSDLGQTYYTESLLKVNKAGVILGSSNTIRPTDNVTWEEAVVILSRALDLSPSYSTVAQYEDMESISSWAAGYVNTMAARGYISNTGWFCPQYPINRVQVVTILYKAIQEIVNQPIEYSGYVDGTIVVNVPGVTLKDVTVTGDLIISEGVGSGDVTLKNVTVSGNTIVRGGGPDSIHIEGSSNIANIIIQKTDNGSIRVVTADGAVVNAVYIEDGKDDIILTGSFKQVTVASDVSIKAIGANITQLDVTANADLDLDKSTKAETVNVSKAAAGANIIVKGSVGSLTANAAITVSNSGSIKTAQVNTNDVKINGNNPTETKVDTSVTNGPTNNGNKINGGSTSTGGSGGSGGGNPGGGGPVTPPAQKTAILSVAAPTKDSSDGGSNIGKYQSFIEQTGIAYILCTAPLDDVTLAEKGTAKWVGLLVEMDKNITTLAIKMPGASSFVNFSQSDITEAQAAGAESNNTNTFVLWFKAEEISAETTVQIKVQGQEDLSAINLTIGYQAYVEHNVSIVSALIPSVDGDGGEYTPTNIGKYSIDMTDHMPIYSLQINGTSPFVNVKTTDDSLDSGKWAGVLVTTNKDITSLAIKTDEMTKYTNLTQADIDKAADAGATGTKTFVIWINIKVQPLRSVFIKSQGQEDETAVQLTIQYFGSNQLQVVSAANPTRDSNESGKTNIGKYSYDSTEQNGQDYMITTICWEPLADIKMPFDQAEKKFVGVLISFNTELTSLAYKPQDGNGFIDMTQADIEDAQYYGASGNKTFMLWVDVLNDVTGDVTLQVRLQSDSDDTAINIKIQIYAYERVEITSLSLINLTSDGSPVAVGDSLRIDVDMDDGRTAENRVYYTAALTDIGNSDFCYLLKTSLSNTFEIPEYITYNGKQTSTQGLYLWVYAIVIFNQTSNKQYSYGPITVVSTEYGIVDGDATELYDAGGNKVLYTIISTSGGNTYEFDSSWVDKFHNRDFVTLTTRDMKYYFVEKIEPDATGLTVVSFGSNELTTSEGTVPLSPDCRIYDTSDPLFIDYQDFVSAGDTVTYILDDTGAVILIAITAHSS